MFRFEHIQYLYALGLIPLFTLIFILAMRWRNNALKKFGEKNLVLQLISYYSKFKQPLKFILLMFSFSFLILAFANPQIGSKQEKVKRKGVDVIIAMDVSNSMLAEDIRPNRLERTKQLVYKLIEKLQNDRIGLIVFAGQAYLQMPVTVDYAAAKMFLNQINTEMVPTQGTVIGNAVRMAMRSFQVKENKHKVLVIITDGEGHDDDAIEAVNEASKEGIIVHTIGVGTSQGAPIPIYRNGQPSDYKRDRDGNIVLTKLDEVNLQRLAASANGKFYILGNSQDDLKNLINQIGSMEKKEFEEKIFTDYDDKFQYPLAVALLFLVLEFFISERKSNLMDRIYSLTKIKKAA